MTTKLFAKLLTLGFAASIWVRRHGASMSPVDAPTDFARPPTLCPVRKVGDAPTLQPRHRSLALRQSANSVRIDWSVAG